jgi:hypothetical protein
VVRSRVLSGAQSILKHLDATRGRRRPPRIAIFPGGPDRNERCSRTRLSGAPGYLCENVEHSPSGETLPKGGPDQFASDYPKGALTKGCCGSGP